MVLLVEFRFVLRLKPTENQTAKVDFGYRFSQMFNLESGYALNGKLLCEPRLNASYTIGETLKHTLRFGFGIENKLPTMDYLYPEKIYKDFWVLNAYTNNPNNRHLITYTKIFDGTNHDIRENRNKKFEVGYDIDYKGFEISLTAFYERSESGFEYFKFYPHSGSSHTVPSMGSNFRGRRYLLFQLKL